MNVKRSMSLLLTAVLLVLLVCNGMLGICACSDALILYPMTQMMRCDIYDGLSTSLKGDEGCNPVQLVGWIPGVRCAVHRLRLDLIRYGTGPPLGQ